MKRFLVCLVSGALLGCVAMRASRLGSAELLFEGKSLRTWAQMIIAQPLQRRAELALLGPRIVPYLVEEMEQRRAPEGLLDRLWLFCYLRMPHALRSTVLGPLAQDERMINGLYALSGLGPDAAAALPMIIRLLQSEVLCGSALSTLRSMGPAAKAATPALLNLLDEPQPFVATTLVAIGADPEVAIPALQAASGVETPLWFRTETAWALGALRSEATRFASTLPSPLPQGWENALGAPDQVDDALNSLPQEAR